MRSFSELADILNYFKFQIGSIVSRKFIVIIGKRQSQGLILITSDACQHRAFLVMSRSTVMMLTWFISGAH